MSDSSADDLTRVLQAASRGEPDAASHLLPLVYDELRALARARMQMIPPGQTLEPTALVHEAYLRVVGRRVDGEWDGRGHFFHAAARAMRDILVEDARRKQTAKRGGGHQRVYAADLPLPIAAPNENLLALDGALTALEQAYPEHAHLVMLRYFTGLTAGEAADVLGTSLSTVERQWRFAKAWLQRETESRRDDDG